MRILSLTAISGPASGSSNRVRLGHANQLVAHILARLANHGELRVLAEGIVKLPVAGDHLALDRREVQQRSGRQGVHAGHQIGEVVLDHEVGAMLLERLDRPRGGLAEGAAERLTPVLAGQVRVLLGARQRELTLDDRLVEHKPGVLMARLRDEFESAQVVETGIKRRRQPLAGRVQPQ